MLVVIIEPEPGQPGLEVGNAIASIAGRHLAGLPADAAEAAFGAGFGDGARIEVVRLAVEEIGVLPDGAGELASTFNTDLSEFARRFNIEVWIQESGLPGHDTAAPATVWACGSPVAMASMPAARMELERLLLFNFPAAQP